jgi:hypothetical protein
MVIGLILFINASLFIILLGELIIVMSEFNIIPSPAVRTISFPLFKV